MVLKGTKLLATTLSNDLNHPLSQRRLGILPSTIHTSKFEDGLTPAFSTSTVYPKAVDTIESSNAAREDCWLSLGDWFPRFSYALPEIDIIHQRFNFPRPFRTLELLDSRGTATLLRRLALRTFLLWRNSSAQSVHIHGIR